MTQENNSNNLVYLIVKSYFDSNFSGRLTKRDNECCWNEFIDECETHNIDLIKGCDPIFTPFLFLESIGLGGVLHLLHSSQGYKTVVKLVQTYIKNMPNPKNLSTVDLKNLQEEIAVFLNGMHEIFYSLLTQMKELKADSLVKLLDEKIEKYATSDAAKELVQLTLKRYRQHLSDHQEDVLANLLGQLTWNLLTTFPFIQPDQISKQEAFVMFEKAKMWFDSLFAFFHDQFINGNKIGFFRLAENRYYTFAKILARDPSNPEFAQVKAWLDQYEPLSRKDDLCDGELIDFAVLGLNGEKVLCFTSDKSLDIKNRLGLLNRTLEDAARDIDGWLIKPIWGQVYCLSEEGPIKVLHAFLLDQNLNL